MKNKLFFGVKQHMRREGWLHLHEPYPLIHALLFFLMIMVFFPLTLPALPHLRHALLPGLIWTAVLLAVLLFASVLFQDERRHGIIEQWLIANYPLSMMVFAMLAIRWVLFFLPLIALCPLIAILFHLSGYETIILMCTLCIGTPTLLLLAALAAAFSAGKGMLMALLLFPLTVPVIILGSGILTAVFSHTPIAGYMAFFLSITLIAVGFLPWVIGLILRISLAH